jgi:hypothetical protein
MFGAFGGAGGGNDRLEGVALEERLVAVVLVEVITLPRIEPESVNGRFGVVLFALEPAGSVELDLAVGLGVMMAFLAIPLAGATSAVAGAMTGASGSPSKSITSSSGSPCIVTCLAP